MAETKKFENDGIIVEVTMPGDDAKGWTVIKQESLSYSKGKSIVEKFNKDFPQFNVSDYKQLTEACSRTRKFSEWLTRANLEFSEIAQLPLFLKDEVDSKVFQEKQAKITEMNRIVALKSAERKRLADEYKAKVKKVDTEEKLLTDKILSDDKILKVLSLNSTYLPFSLQLQIQNYVPTDLQNPQESRRSYGREVLIQYKRALVQAINKNNEIDIDAVISSNEVK